MKKVIIIIALAIAAFVACEKNPVENTATVAMAGQWYVQYHVVDADCNIIAEDFFGLGNSLALTFNTAYNTPDTIWVSDSKDINFLGYQLKVPCNQSDLTFGSDEQADNVCLAGAIADGDIGTKAIIKNGKILLGAATTPSGMPADSICYELIIDADGYAAYYGYDHYLVTGYRYTGFAADE